MKIRVLFVCMGNICRSPMAEAVFVHKVREAGLEDRIEADSAGTGDWHVGLPAHEGTLAILQEKEVAYNGRARQIKFADLDAFDYIVTMDDDNLRNVKRLGSGRAVVKPLLEFAAAESHSRQQRIREVPDPYFTGGFDVVYGLVNEGAQGLLDTIRREHKL